MKDTNFPSSDERDDPRGRARHWWYLVVTSRRLNFADAGVTSLLRPFSEASTSSSSVGCIANWYPELDSNTRTRLSESVSLDVNEGVMSVSRRSTATDESALEVNAFDAFFRATYERLVGAMTLYTGNRADGEDIAQEALARACSNWTAVAMSSSPEAWVHRVALNVAHSWYRRLRTARRFSHLDDERQVSIGASDDALSLKAALLDLPPRQRQAVVLRYYADFSTSEAAEAMHCAEGTVRALAAQGVSALRRGRKEMEVFDA